MKYNEEKDSSKIKKLSKTELQDIVDKCKYQKDIFKYINLHYPQNFYKNLFIQECQKAGIDTSKLIKNSKKIDLKDRIFGYLKVIERGPTLECGNTSWICLEEKTGIIKPVLTKHLLKGSTKSFSFSGRKKGLSKNWRGHGEISGSLWNGIFKKAIQRNIEFNITINFAWELFLKQERKCKLSGMYIYFGESNEEPNTASLDRIDSSRGYTEDNIQWVHKDINWMKNSFNQNYFIQICKLIAQNK